MNRIIAKLKKQATANFEVVGYNHVYKGDTIYLIDSVDEKFCEGIENSSLSNEDRTALVEKIKNYFINQAQSNEQFFKDNITESVIMHIKDPYIPNTIVNNKKLYELCSVKDQTTKEPKLTLSKFNKLTLDQIQQIIPDLGKYFDWMYKEDYMDKKLGTYNFCALAKTFVPDNDEDDEK